MCSFVVYVHASCLTYVSLLGVTQPIRDMYVHIYICMYIVCVCVTMQGMYIRTYIHTAPGSPAGTLGWQSLLPLSAPAALNNVLETGSIGTVLPPAPSPWQQAYS